MAGSFARYSVRAAMDVPAKFQP